MYILFYNNERKRQKAIIRFMMANFNFLFYLLTMIVLYNRAPNKRATNVINRQIFLL
jgi:hypothetical protein